MIKIWRYTCVWACSLQLMACGVGKPIAKQAQQTVLADSLLATAHIGICVYDATDGKYLYNYQGNKYFIPASNTKIATCYAAMKYLGDSLVGLRYQDFSDTAINIFATGDPSFLHEDFKSQPVFDFLKNEKRAICFSLGNWQENALGRGWSWDDYNDDYMVERSALPVNANTVKIGLKNKSYINQFAEKLDWEISPSYFSQYIDSIFAMPLKDRVKFEFSDTSATRAFLNKFNIQRKLDGNELQIVAASAVFKKTEIPYHTNNSQTAVDILKTEYSLRNFKNGVLSDQSLYHTIPNHSIIHTIHSQPTDSLLKIMMHRSDNFYAEQSLLMVGNEHIGVMNDAKIIDTLLTTDYAAMPQRPQWVDGSGLSRYNLFTPQDFVFILNKMRNEFSWNRITTIFSTGGDGTLGSYYKSLKGKIFAKTGSLSNNIALSGYLITKKNKTHIFSVLVNNHTTSSSAVRKAVERFLTAVQRDN